ncbi:MAG: PEP-CTERM sorting domain-containing protein [Verrucomicrobiota bacterium]
MNLKYLAAAATFLTTASFSNAVILNFDRLIDIPTGTDEVPGTQATPLGIAFGGAGNNLRFVAFPDNPKTVHEITTSGVFVSSTPLPSPDTNRDISGMTFLPNGNLLLIDDNPSLPRVYEVNPTTYAPVGSGIDFNPNFPLLPHRAAEATGVAFHEARNSIFVASKSDNEIIEFDLDGNALNSFFTTNINAGFTAPEGIAVDPSTGNLLIADSAFGAVYETTFDGTLLETTNVEALTGRQFPTGLSIDAANSRLYVSFAEALPTDTIALFVMGVPVPEPTTALLSLLGAFSLLARRRRG